MVILLFGGSYVFLWFSIEYGSLLYFCIAVCLCHCITDWPPPSPFQQKLNSRVRPGTVVSGLGRAGRDNRLVSVLCFWYTLYICSIYFDICCIPTLFCIFLVRFFKFSCFFYRFMYLFIRCYAFSCIFFAFLWFLQFSCIFYAFSCICMIFLCIFMYFHVFLFFLWFLRMFCMFQIFTLFFAFFIFLEILEKSKKFEKT